MKIPPRFRTVRIQEMVLILWLACAATLAAQQQAWSWREFTYPSDGFAIAFPYAPTPHPDSTNPNLKVYTIQLSRDSAISVRVIEVHRLCTQTLQMLRDAAHAKNQLLHSIRVEGHDGLESETSVAGSNQMKFERYLCTEQRYYIFSMSWPKGQSKPPDGVRIVDSFRLLR